MADTICIDSLTNSAMQDVLKTFRKNKMPEPWGEGYLKLRESVRAGVEAQYKDHIAALTVQETR